MSRRSREQERKATVAECGRVAEVRHKMYMVGETGLDAMISHAFNRAWEIAYKQGLKDGRRKP